METLLILAVIAVIAGVAYGLVSCAKDMAEVTDEKSSCTEADYDLSDKLAAKKY